MNFKKICIVVISLVGVLLISLLAGCGAKKDARSQEVIKIRYAHYNPTTSVSHKMGNALFAKLIEEKTNGKVKVEMYPGATLGKASDQYEMVTSGIADIAWGFTGFNPGRFPLSEVVTLPMLGIDTAEMGTKILWDLYNNTDYLKKEYQGVKVLVLHTHDGSPISSKEPIKSMNDMAGLKIRTPGGPPLAMAQALGASPMVIPAPDIYQAAEKGVINAVAISWEGQDMLNIQEVYKNMLDCDYFVGVWWVIISQKKWDSLPPDVQKALEEVSGDVGGKIFANVYDGNKQAFQEKLKKNGVSITKLTPEETKLWREKARLVWDKWANDMEAKGLPGKAVLAETLRLIEKYKAEK